MIGDVVSLFQSFRTILCVCPHCGDILRLGDLHLRYKGAAPHTWLDTYDSKVQLLDRQTELFEEKERKLHDAAVERGRAKVPKMICRCVDEDIAGLNYDPYDIKPLLHPVDFVVFNGLNDGRKLEDITFLSRRTRIEFLAKIRQSLESAIDHEKYDWRVARVSLDGRVQFEGIGATPQSESKRLSGSTVRAKGEVT